MTFDIPCLTRAVAFSAILSSAVGLVPQDARASDIANYKGRFQSACMALSENGLNFIDVVELAPKDAKTVSVQLSKMFFAQEGCVARSAIGSLHLPSGQWVIDGEVILDKRHVDKVTIDLPAGPVEIRQPANAGPRKRAPGSIKIEGEMIHIRFGKKGDLSLSRQAVASTEKDLRWVYQHYLAVGDPASVGADKYPTKLAEDIFLRSDKVKP